MRSLLALVVLTTVLSACGSDSPTQPTQASVAGTWNLTTVNGATLPFLIQADPMVELVNDQLIVSASGTFTDTSNLRYTTAGQVTLQPVADAGTYTISGTAVTFRFNSDGSTFTATAIGNTFTAAEGAFSTVYTRQ